MKRLYSYIAGIGLLFGVGTTAWAQLPEVFSPTDFHEPFNEVTPFVEPFYFDHDFQFFAPADIDEFGGYPEPSTGWFVDYDRMYLNFSRGEDSFQEHEGDFTYGNRYQLGYMLEDDNGWLFEYMHIDGPTKEFVNNGEYDSVELNKVFRLEPLSNGGNVELFLGPKYIGFTDKFDPFNKVQNVMITAQGGVRYAKRKGRWLLSTEARIYGGPNFQFYSSDNRDEFVIAGEFRGDATLILTRDIGIQAGVQVQHFGGGIGRGPNIADNDEDLTAAGLYFGLVFNRF